MLGKCVWVSGFRCCCCLILGFFFCFGGGRFYYLHVNLWTSSSCLLYLNSSKDGFVKLMLETPLGDQVLGPLLVIKVEDSQSRSVPTGCLVLSVRAEYIPVISSNLRNDPFTFENNLPASTVFLFPAKWSWILSTLSPSWWSFSLSPPSQIVIPIIEHCK